jgi:hypothetical protein
MAQAPSLQKVKTVLSREFWSYNAKLFTKGIINLIPLLKQRIIDS